MNRALLPSIHDVMPETLPQVAGILDMLAAAGIHRATLLVVPGRAWRAEQLAQLRRWQQSGHALAGHGWCHRVERLRGPYARLHGLLLSRRAGEHLALDEAGIIALMRRCHAWFRANDLKPPALYVPPAWALGAISPAGLSRQPFSLVETLTGVRETRSGAFRWLPVVGFEADTALRAAALGLSNALMRGLARARPLRLAIHPHDRILRLRRSLHAHLSASQRIVDYGGLARHLPAA